VDEKKTKENHDSLLDLRTLIANKLAEIHHTNGLIKGCLPSNMKA
jgi:hypothetical protein